jgi:predicted metal-dependent enzyme (double-stranded beta helix superfamily)
LPYQREAEIVLARWRAVERDLATIPADAPDAEHLQSEATRLRNEYKRLIEEAVRHHRPVPPPFPESDTPVTSATPGPTPGLQRGIHRLLERIAVPAAADPPDLAAIGEALVELADQVEDLRPSIEQMDATGGGLALHAPAGHGPRLTLVHRPDGQMSAVHDHGTWVVMAPISGLETHRRYRMTGTRPADGVEVAETLELTPSHVATLLPPDDIHDHGHLAGHGAPAYILILLGDDQRRYTRNEWDPVTGRHRVLEPGDGGRWLASEPMPEA